MDVKLDDNTLKDIIAKSIIDSLTSEKREALIAEALKALLGEKAGDRYDSPTRIQRAFSDAAQGVALDIAKQVLAEPEQRDRIRKLVVDAVDKALDVSTYDSITDTIGSAVRKALTGDRY